MSISDINADATNTLASIGESAEALVISSGAAIGKTMQYPAAGQCYMPWWTWAINRAATIAASGRLSPANTKTPSPSAMAIRKWRQRHEMILSVNSIAKTPSNQPAKTPPKITGLGDAIALIAKPIARALDRVAGTKLEHCQPCARRQAKLNRLLPFS